MSRPRGGMPGVHDRDSRPAAVTGANVPWPIVMSCGECGRWGARAYPFPMFEDQELFEDPLSVTRGATLGTVWCQHCDPWWGEALLQMCTTWTIHWRPGVHRPEPDIPLLGGLPVEQIAFLESELADFFDGPGPLSFLRPGWYGEGPVAPRSEAFVWACADLVAFMRERRGIGFLSFGLREAAA